jgi:hypothetical protein
MSATDVFVREYIWVKKAQHTQPGLVKATCLLVADLKAQGLSQSEVEAYIKYAIQQADGGTVETERLDGDLIITAIEEFNRPSSPPITQNSAMGLD